MQEMPNLRHIVPPIAIKAGYDFLTESRKRWTAGLANSRFFTLEGDILLKTWETSACHSNVTRLFDKGGYYANKDEIKKGVVVATSHTKKRSSFVDPESHSALADFICSDENPFGKYVINRDDKDMTRDGGILLLCGGEHGLKNEMHAMWVCKVLRYAVEQNQSAEVWYYLYRNGIPPLVALYVSERYQSKSSLGYAKTLPLTHCSVFTWGDYGESACLKGLQSKTLAPNPARTLGVFGVNETFKGAAFFGKYKPEVGARSDGWGGTIKGEAFSLEQILRIAKDLMETVK